MYGSSANNKQQHKNGKLYQKQLDFYKEKLTQCTVCTAEGTVTKHLSSNTEVTDCSQPGTKLHEFAGSPFFM